MNCCCAACSYILTGTCSVLKFYGKGAFWFVSNLENKLRIENVNTLYYFNVE
jgi:hypothetical protein